MAFLIYKVIMLMRRTNSGAVAKGVLLLLFALGVSTFFHLNTVSYLLQQLMVWGVVALVVIFQPEIRRFLEQMGRTSLGKVFTPEEARNELDSAITQTVDAYMSLSKSKTGALMVFERKNMLDDAIKTGTALDCTVNAELLKNIFWNKAPLHDGAVIVRAGRIVGAGCMLPMSGNVNLSRELGMRHRAGIGASEHTDAVVAIVSEETGSISVAVGGMLKRHLAPETLERLLRNELLPERENDEAASKFKLGNLLRFGKGKKQDGTKILNSRWFYVVLSILLAFLLWVYVGNDPSSVDTGTLRNVRVVFSGLEKLEERGLMISEGAEQTVNLQLSARGEVWSRLNQGDTTVVVDVSGITEPGEQSVAITSRNINFPRSITIIDSIDVRYTSPSTIDFTVSRWSSKEIPVQGTFNGSVAEGFQRRDFSFAPDTITVSGQEELVSQVDHAQITISQEDMNSTYSADCSYTLIGTNGQPIAAGLVETEPETVLVTLPVEKMKEVELTVDLIPGGGATADNVTVDIEPRTLMVAGSAEILDQLDRISLGEIDLSRYLAP